MAHVLDHPVCRGSSRHHFHLHRVMQKGDWQSREIGPGIVAEKRSDWRRAGSRAMTRLTSGANPMSSIRSASSRTNTPTPLISTQPCLGKIEEATRAWPQRYPHLRARRGPADFGPPHPKDHCMPERQNTYRSGQNFLQSAAAKLTRGGQHKHLWPPRYPCRRMLAQAMQNWQSKRGPF